MQKLSYSLVFIITLLLAGCADAGQDKVAKSATIIVLEGNASTTSVGGEIKKYKWKQVSGTKVKINNSKNKIITFTAPTVETEKILVFRLDTTEEGGHPNKFVTYDCVRVKVQPSIGTDTTAPVITLNGESNITLYVGETYVEADATALDDADGNVDVNLTGIVDTDTVGKYIITYTAVDTAGNSVSIQRIVHVVENDDVNETNTTVQSISDGSENEGGTIIHEVNLSELTTVSTVFDYKIESEMAMVNIDFNATPLFSNDNIAFDTNHSTITVPAGINSFEIRIETFKDIIYEVPETYRITLENKNATGIILETVGDDTNTTVKSISDDVSDSVNTATYNVVMTAELNESKEYSFSITGESNITTPQPSFTNGVTYNAELEIITVPAGIVDFSISVAVVEDVVYGKDKFIITIDGVSNKPIVTLPRFVISDANVIEEENNLTFIITLSDVSASDTIISVHTTSGTALEGQDYEAVTTDVIISTGETTAIVVVPVIDDAITENIEMMTLNGTSGDTVNMSATGTGTIISWDDEDRPKRFTISDANATEGGNNLTFIITLSGVSPSDTVITVNTISGTALEGQDYEAVTTDVIISTGSTTAIVVVPVIDDAITENIEMMTLNGTSGDTVNMSATGTGTIISWDDEDTHTKIKSISNNVSEDNSTAVYHVMLESNVSINTRYNIEIFNKNTKDTTHEDAIVSASQDTFTISIPLIIDSLEEADHEPFIITIDGVSNHPGIEPIEEINATAVKSISNNVSTEEGVAVYNVLLEGNVSEDTNYTAEIYNTITKEITFKENIVPAGKNDFNITLVLTNNTIPEDMDLFKITIDGVSNNPYLHPVPDNNNTQVENNNSITFEKGQYGDLNLTADWSIPNGAVFIDIREDWERIEARPTGAVGGAIYGNQSFVEDVRKLVNNTNKQIILVCHSGSRTTGASELLSNAGFSNVWQIVGGMISWQELKPSEILTGLL